MGAEIMKYVGVCSCIVLSKQRQFGCSYKVISGIVIRLIVLVDQSRTECLMYCMCHCYIPKIRNNSLSSSFSLDLALPCLRFSTGWPKIGQCLVGHAYFYMFEICTFRKHIDSNLELIVDKTYYNNSDCLPNVFLSLDRKYSNFFIIINPTRKFRPFLLSRLLLVFLVRL